LPISTIAIGLLLDLRVGTLLEEEELLRIVAIANYH